MDALIKAVKSLIVDIESMQGNAPYDSNWFGPFSEIDEVAGIVEWPNLAIQLELVKRELAKAELQQHPLAQADMAEVERRMLAIQPYKSMAMQQLAHWHEHNPWKDDLIYTTIDEVVRLMADDNKIMTPTGMRTKTPEWIRNNYLAQYGDKLDPYILTGGSVGVRYGPEGEQYLSPGVDPRRVIRFLVNKLKEQT